MGENNQNNIVVANKGVLWKIWRVVRIPLVIIIVLFIVLMIYRYPVVKERMRTEEVVKQIQAQKITLADVMGENLPPEPNADLKDATLEGIDANYNGIRDDVELAILKLHPDSARIRAAQLQYAKVLQNEMTSNVFNSETLVAVMKQESRGFSCISEATRITNDHDLVIKRRDEVDGLVFNNVVRRNRQEEIYRNFMTSYTLPNSDYCDIDLKSLSN